MKKRLYFAAWLMVVPMVMLSRADNHIFDPDLPGIGSRQLSKEQVDLMCKVCWDHTYSNPRLALRYGQEAATGAEASGYLHGSIKAHNLMGIVYDVLAVYDSALFHYRRAHDLSLIHADTAMIASNLTNIGLTHWHTGNFREALSYFFQALTLFEARNSKYGQAACLNNIGLIYLDLKNNDRALKSFHQSLAFYKAINHQLGCGAVYTNLGRLWAEQNDYQKARDYLSQSLAIKTAENDAYGLSITYRQLGTLMKQQQKMAEAQDCFQKSIDYARQVNDPGEESSSLLQLADLNRIIRNRADVLPLASKALELAKRVKSQKLEGDVYKFLSDYHQQKGNIALSYDYYRKFKEIEGNMVNASRMNQLLDLEMQMLSKRKSDEIAVLNRQKNVQELLIERQQLVLRQRNLLLFVVGSLLLLTIVSVFFIIRENRLRQQRRTQNQLQQLIEKQLREVLEAELGERKRIGEELHDSLGQSLSLIKLNVSSLRDVQPSGDRFPDLVGNLLNLVDGAFSELRTISHNMAPIMLKEKGLTEAVRDLVDRLIESKTFVIEFGVTGKQPHLNPLTEHSLYRVVQEILNNIIQHSNATACCLQMIFDGNELTIMAEDNGCGFDPTNPEFQKGMGINNIRKRIANLRGQVEIDSAIDRGTTITITLPL